MLAIVAGYLDINVRAHIALPYYNCVKLEWLERCFEEKTICPFLREDFYVEKTLTREVKRSSNKKSKV
jgi:hypothetical protein